jgi:hypothetical protein
MTETQLAILLRTLAIEAKLLGKLLSRCAAASSLAPSLAGPWLESAILDLQRLALRAEAVAEFVVRE